MFGKLSVRLRTALLLLAALGILGSVCESGGEAFGRARSGQETPQTPPPQNIYFTALNAGSFNTFIELVRTAGLVDTLKGSGPFTVFAPTDEAFAKLPKHTLEELRRPENRERLKELLTSHIFPVKATASELSKLKEARTLRRNTLRIETSNGLKVGDANVTQQDINASNGVIHAIDSVLLP